jgi:putative addiction module component (TIGR02574 family)
MSNDVPSILEAALTLPDSDRANIAFQLLSSLQAPGIQSEQDPKLLKEIERRLTNYDTGVTTATSIDDVSKRILIAIRDRKSP